MIILNSDLKLAAWRIITIIISQLIGIFTGYWAYSDCIGIVLFIVLSSNVRFSGKAIILMILRIKHLFASGDLKWCSLWLEWTNDHVGSLIPVLGNRGLYQANIRSWVQKTFPRSFYCFWMSYNSQGHFSFSVFSLLPGERSAGFLHYGTSDSCIDKVPYWYCQGPGLPFLQMMEVCKITMAFGIYCS